MTTLFMVSAAAVAGLAASGFAAVDAGTLHSAVSAAASAAGGADAVAAGAHGAATAAGEAGAAAGDALFSVRSAIALLTLAALEIVLGIDNIIFIAILTGKLPEHQRAKARQLGLLLAMGMRIVLLLAITWVLKLTTPLFTIPFLTQHVVDAATGIERTVPIAISGKDLVLLLGGLFLIGKSTWEIRHQVAPGDHGGAGGHGPGGAAARPTAAFGAVLTQILLLDIVFSLDSVITAAGMTSHIPIMIAGVVIAVGVMLAFAGPVSRFVERNPSIKVLALAFLIMIGVLLTAEGLHQHFERGYVYFAMAFALVVDLLQMRVKPAPKPAAGAEAGATD